MFILDGQQQTRQIEAHSRHTGLSMDPFSQLCHLFTAGYMRSLNCRIIFEREEQTRALLPGGGLRGRRGSHIVGGSGCLVAAERGCALGGPPRFHLLATSANRRESRENVSHTRGTIGRQRPIILSPEHD